MTSRLDAIEQRCREASDWRNASVGVLRLHAPSDMPDLVAVARAAQELDAILCAPGEMNPANHPNPEGTLLGSPILRLHDALAPLLAEEAT